MNEFLFGSWYTGEDTKQEPCLKDGLPRTFQKYLLITSNHRKISMFTWSFIIENELSGRFYVPQMHKLEVSTEPGGLS